MGTHISRQLVVAGLGILMLVVVFLCGYGLGRSTWSREGCQIEAKELFLGARKAEDRTTISRMDAAAGLARLKNGESWAILILLRQEALGDGAEWVSEKTRGALEAAPRSVVASLLENIDASASDALLWAVTYRLNDAVRGSYSGRWPQGLGSFGMEFLCYTDEIRDLAREALKRALREDHGYDAEAWRYAILNRNPSKGSGEGN